MAENEYSINDAPTMKPAPIPGSDRRFAAGDTILGRYAVVRELGEGGMGVVYQCLDTVGGVEVAVKGLPPEVSRNADEMDDIRANYQIVRKLRHPNIAGVATLEKDAAVGDYYLVMDLAAGTTLKRWARRHPDAGLDAKLAILRQVAAALDYAHAEKVIHRDVKPENVMVDDDGRVKVLDFGLAAQIRSSQSRTSNTVTSKGGTPGYKSPEQWLGRPQQVPADVYAFGVMAYWLFSGRLPFDGDDPVVLGHAVLTAPVEPIPDLPAHINAALVKALAKSPEDRFASCGAFMDALEGKVRSRWRDGRVEGSRSRVTAILVIAALVLAVVGGWWYVNARAARSTGATGIPPVAPSLAEAERAAHEARNEATELTSLRTQIDIRIKNAKAKMERVAAFRTDPEGLSAHIDSAAGQWKKLSELGTPATLEEARKISIIAEQGEIQISLDLDWLEKNKRGRDSAKAAVSAINELIAGDITTFNAKKLADPLYRAGASLRENGLAAFKKGDFDEAGRLLGEAKAKFADAAREAKAFFVKTTLKSAKAYFDAEKWKDCVSEADKVLGCDADNEAAAQLKKDAKSHLVASLRVVAKVDGRVIDGAKMTVDGTEQILPLEWKNLKDGECHGPYMVLYESGGKRYSGVFDFVTVDWCGLREIPVELKEYAESKHGDTKTITLPGGATMEMIYVASGSFMMGRDDGYDVPIHKVTLTRGFWMGKYEVTQAQWKSVMGSNPSSFKGDDRPVDRVSWSDCQKFIKKVNADLGDGVVRLPTEAEWEYACRAGTKSDYAGTGKLDDMGWDYDNSGEGSQPVGRKKPNAWGFYDMHGNVAEWCNDWYGDYPTGKVVDPPGAHSGSYRVLRGGSWFHFADGCRSSDRDHDDPADKHYSHGFRLCCSAGPRE